MRQKPNAKSPKRQDRKRKTKFFFLNLASWRPGVRIATLALFSVVVLLALIHQCREHYPTLNATGDWAVYYRAGQAMAHRQPIYTLEHGELLTFKNAPVIALLVAPLTLLPSHVARFVWFIGDLALLWSIFAICRRLLPAKNSIAQAWIAIGAWALTDRFIMFQLGAGTNAVLYIALSLAACYSIVRGRPLTAGAALAGAVFLKLVPICLLPYFLLHRRPVAAFTSFALTSIALALLPAMWVGWDANRQMLTQWPQHLRDTETPEQNARPTNQSVYAMLSRLIGPKLVGDRLIPGRNPSAITKYRPHLYFTGSQIHTLWLALSVITAIGLYVFLWRTRSETRLPDSTRAATHAMHFSLLLIYMTLFNPLAWRYNFIALLIPYYFILHTAVHHTTHRRTLIRMLAIAYVLTTLPLAIHGLPWLDIFQVYSARVWGTLIVAAAVIVAGRFSDPLPPVPRGEG